MRTVLVLLLIGCGTCEQALESVASEEQSAAPGEETEPSTWGHRLPEGESWAYRVLSGMVDPEDRSGPLRRQTEKTFFLERDDDGDLIVREGSVDNAELVCLYGAPDSQVRMQLPLPRGLIVEGEQEHEWATIGLGVSTNVQKPAHEVTERFDVHSVGADSVTLSVERTLVAGTFLNATVNGEATYDPVAGRVTRWVEQSEVTMTTESIGSHNTYVRTELSYDAELSAQRTQRLAEIETARESAGDDYDTYVAAHPVDAEIQEALAGASSLRFHLNAHPARIWQSGLDAPRATRDSFLRQVTPYLRITPSLAAAGLSALRERAFADPSLTPAIVSVGERARPLITELAASSSEARMALERLGTRPTLESLQGVDDSTFVRNGTTLMTQSAEAADLVPLAGALIEILATTLSEETPPASGAAARLGVNMKRDVCIQWLEGITRQTHGRDIDAWRSFWSTHRERSFGAWLIEAAGDGEGLMRTSALQGLAALPASGEAIEVATRNLEHPHEDVQVYAAAALARWGHALGVATLVDFLSSTRARQTVAFLALGYVAESTLGFDPAGPEVERVAATERWKAWLERRSESGQ